MIDRHAIVYSCFTPDPAQSLFFGGGATGGTVHTPDDSLYLLISRGDLWNETASMGAIAAVRLRGNKGLFTAPNTIRQVCDIDAANIALRIDTPSGEVRLTLTCLRDRDVVLLDIEDGRRNAEAWTVSLENWHEDDTTGPANTRTLETIHTNRSSVFAQINRAVGVDAAELGIADPILGRCWGLWISSPNAQCDGDTLVLPGATHQRIAIATACVPPDLIGDAETILKLRGRALVQSSMVLRYLEWKAGSRKSSFPPMR